MILYDLQGARVIDACFLDLNEIEIVRKLEALRPWYFLGLFIKVQTLNLAYEITLS
jgi:hypothetical protein